MRRSIGQLVFDFAVGRKFQVFNGFEDGDLGAWIFGGAFDLAQPGDGISAVVFGDGFQGSGSNLRHRAGDFVQDLFQRLRIVFIKTVFL